MRDQSFHDFVVGELLSDIPHLSSRAMFGGWGLYSDGKIFGIISDSTLYFKVDDSNRELFESLDSGPFTFEKKGGRAVSLSYWLVPEEVYDDRELLAALADSAIAVALKET